MKCWGRKGISPPKKLRFCLRRLRNRTWALQMDGASRASPVGAVEVENIFYRGRRDGLSNTFTAVRLKTAEFLRNTLADVVLQNFIATFAAKT